MESLFLLSVYRISYIYFIRRKRKRRNKSEKQELEEEFEEERILEIILGNRDAAPEELIEKVIAGVRDHAGNEELEDRTEAQERERGRLGDERCITFRIDRDIGKFEIDRIGVGDE